MAKYNLDRRFHALRRIAQILVPEYRFKWPQVDWWRDEKFTEYLGRFGEANGMNSDRRWMIQELMLLATNVPGDTAECGVFAGSSSYVICKANQVASQQGKRHHMFDSFEGLSPPTEHDGTHWTKGDLSYGLAKVKDNLKEFELTSYYPGWIPERFQDVADLKFSFVHIDVDLFEPTRDSFEFFYSRLSPGGVMVVDDYAFSTCPGATKAVDELLVGQPERMVRLSGGGGFIVKGIQTNPTAKTSRAAA